MKSFLLALPLPILFAASMAASQSVSPPQPATAGKVAFAQCAACHSVKPGVNGLGPSLAGIAGRSVAGVAGFNYSPAMRAKGGTWTDANLDAFLKNPSAAIRNNRMPFGGIADPGKRAAIIAYLKRPG